MRSFNGCAMFSPANYVAKQDSNERCQTSSQARNRHLKMFKQRSRPRRRTTGLPREVHIPYCRAAARGVESVTFDCTPVLL